MTNGASSYGVFSGPIMRDLSKSVRSSYARTRMLSMVSKLCEYKKQTRKLILTGKARRKNVILSTQTS